MKKNRNHPWYHAAIYIRAAFVEETNQIAVATAEKAARYLEKAVDSEHEITDEGSDDDENNTD